MAITLSEAKEMFYTMVKNAQTKYTIDDVWEIELDEPIYVATVLDAEGNQFLPGEVFPCIKKENGELIDWKFPLTG